MFLLFQVVVVQRYAAYVQAGGKEDGVEAQSELLGMLQGVGIASPVTKEMAGNAYHEQLARQFADLLLTDNRLRYVVGLPWLWKVLCLTISCCCRSRRLGSILTLTDAYCLYNRARGTDLVSPEDLLQAATLLRPLRLGLHLDMFPSGVKVPRCRRFQ